GDPLHDPADPGPQQGGGAVGEVDEDREPEDVDGDDGGTHRERRRQHRRARGETLWEEGDEEDGELGVRHAREQTGSEPGRPAGTRRTVAVAGPGVSVTTSATRRNSGIERMARTVRPGGPCARRIYSRGYATRPSSAGLSSSSWRGTTRTV